MAIAKVRMAIDELCARDPVFRAHVAKHETCDLKPRSGGRAHFEQLARAVAFQQLAGRAASTIWGRVRELVPGDFTAEAVLALTHGQLRSAGLSTAKALSIADLAEHVVDGRLPLDRIARQPEEAIIEELTRVRGIGRWTAEMFLMFQLGKLNVWPVGDLGVRAGYRALYELDELPTVNELEQLGERFRPYRSVAAWYCWRAADTVVPGAAKAASRSGSKAP